MTSLSSKNLTFLHQRSWLDPVDPTDSVGHQKPYKRSSCNIQGSSIVEIISVSFSYFCISTEVGIFVCFVFWSPVYRKLSLTWLCSWMELHSALVTLNQVSSYEPFRTAHKLTFRIGIWWLVILLSVIILYMLVIFFYS